MKITQLHLAGQEAWPELSIEQVAPELNVVFGHARSGKSTVAQLAAQLLYGRGERSGRRQVSRATGLADGSIEVDSPQGSFVLRRHRDGTSQGRLSIAAASGTATDNQTIRSLLNELPPALAAALYFVDFAQAPQAAELLTGEFAREFSAALAGACAAPDVTASLEPSSPAAAEPCGRRQVDELVRRRDETIRQIEQLVARLRRDGQSLEEKLQSLEATLATKRDAAERLLLKLREADARLAETDTRLRYFAIMSAVRGGRPVDATALADQLSRLDAEISQCRQMLSDLQLRESAVRRELAEAQPDGTADGAASLADQRATMGVLERLLDELDAEVAQLARGPQTDRSIDADAHGRFGPVAQLLRQQVYTLCGQITEQERAALRARLHAESRQLARAQADLSEQLEHLLERRRSIVHESELVNRTVVLTPQPPADAHCLCHDHARFVQSADAMTLARGNRQQQAEHARLQRAEQQRERDALRAQCDAVQREIEQLTGQWQRLQRQRSTSAETATLDELRRTLDQIELALSRALSGDPLTGSDESSPAYRQTWKASDALAQMTDGQLMQIRAGRENQDASIVDRTGRVQPLEALPADQQDQAYLALTLALVSSLSARGIDLPLFLDEPFLRQHASGAANMAGVLHDFARQGRQIFVLTENRDAVRRFEALGANIVDIERLRREARPRVVAAAAVNRTAAPPEAPAPTTALRVVREPVGDRKPQLRVTGEWMAADDKPEVYYLDRDASIADFPVFGNATADVFGRLGIETVRELILANPTEIADRLQRPAITRDTVELWQTHMRLMCSIPGVSLNDAQVLAANNVASPEALLAVDATLLVGAIERFLGADRGRRFASARRRFTTERLQKLQQHARNQRSRWESDPLIRPASRPASPIRAREKQTRAPRKAASSGPRDRAASARPSRPLRFLLGRSSPVVDAPSIGSVAARKLAKAGIRTVADLLNANPQSLAEELGERRVTREVITRWQQEARLACCIPELRSRAARLLIAAGLTEPSQVAGIEPADLVKRISAACQTPAGKRILQNGAAPTRPQIERWAHNAKRMRSLEAA